MFRKTAKNFFTRAEKERIANAIKHVEQQTSGEICVHLATRGRGNIMEQTMDAFKKLGMVNTRERNGVLIYLSLRNRQFSILGDQGIHGRVGTEFWEESASKMSQSFSKGEFEKGVLETIYVLGNHLKKHFPRKPDDRNELPSIA